MPRVMADLSQKRNTPKPPEAGHKLGIRENITQALLRASEKDCNDSRHRFIPRGALLSVINIQCVERVLQAIMGQTVGEEGGLQKIARDVSPRTGECYCGVVHCTGRRMILAMLILCGREDLILSSSLSKPRFCDQVLPLEPDLYEDLRIGLSAREKELLLHMQWQVYTPFLTDLDPGDPCAMFPEEVSLPWMQKERIGSRVLGEVSFVEKIEIYPRSHNLISNNAEVFALKTFVQRLAPGLSEKRFRQEVVANLQAPQHDRIVRLLTAFVYREQFYLLFPYANEGSLARLWKSYNPNGVPLEPNQVSYADWNTDNWLIGECLGIADALAAIHGLADESHHETKMLLHADIKPENILCFRDGGPADPPVLKLADFGEARVVEPGVPLRASRVAHVLTYRPPEHSPYGLVTLNYDVWCLGCLFLDFVTWAILGQDGVDSFSCIREDEQGGEQGGLGQVQLIEDTFFRRDPASLKSTRLQLGSSKKVKVENGWVMRRYSLWAASRLKLTSRLKDGVVSQLSSLGQHPRCSDDLRQILQFVGPKMLVVDPEKRATSRQVRDFLKNLWNGS